ncbi:MAG TPA: DUF6084 family protein [Acidobacteriaceae bacterium]|nr:DUF6084 family protein [Acidobacteriaceae bacterium]
MPDLRFQVTQAAAAPFAAVPLLGFQLQIDNASPREAIHTIALRCQIQIEAGRRRYTPEEQHRMLDLFGEPDRWSQTLRSLLWTHVNLVVPAFEGSGTTVELPVPCTFDFNVAATKYFHGLAEGEIPLRILFSGTVFYAQPDSGLQVAPIPWDRETTFKLSLKDWREMMDAYYPNSAWLTLRKDVFDRLSAYKREHGIPTWEQTLENMLPAEAVVKS